MSVRSRRAAGGSDSPMRGPGRYRRSTSATRRNGAKLSAAVAPAGPAPTTSTSMSRGLVVEPIGEAANLLDPGQIDIIGGVGRVAFHGQSLERVLGQILHLERRRKMGIARSRAWLDHSHVAEICDHVVEL